MGPSSICALIILAAGVLIREPVDDLQQGRRLLDQNRIDEALQAFDQFKQAHPGDYRPYLYSGVALARAGRVKDAGVELQQADALGVKRREDSWVQAQVLKEMGRLNLASEALWPFRAQLGADELWFLADLYYQQQRHLEALPLLEAYAGLRPHDPRLPVRLGELSVMAKDYPRAKAHFEAAIEQDPDQSRAHFGLAQALWLNYESEQAKSAFLRSVELEPENPTYLHLLGIVCIEMGQVTEAIGYLERAGEQPEASAKIFFDLGNAYRKAGETVKARGTLQRYQELYSAEEHERNREQQVVQLNNQGVQQIESGQAGQARQSFQRALEADPESWQAHLSLAKIYLSSRALTLAYNHLLKLLEADADSSEANYLMAYYWYEKRDLPRSLGYAQKAKRLRPGHSDLRNLLGNVYYGLEQKEEALHEYRAAMKLAPDRPGFRANYESLARALKR